LFIIFTYDSKIGFEVCRRALMMEAARTSETMVNFYRTAWCYNPEGCHLMTVKLKKQPLRYQMYQNQIEFFQFLPRNY
jgi:hypothetical protein